MRNIINIYFDLIFRTAKAFASFTTDMFTSNHPRDLHHKYTHETIIIIIIMVIDSIINRVRENTR